MTTGHAFVTGLAVLHLLLTACGAMGLRLFPEDTPAWRILRLYGEAAGTDNRYGFFAPAVSSQVRGQFILTGANGETWIDTLERGNTRESNLRLGGLTDTVWASGEIDEPQLRSWAAAALGRHPRADRVVVRLEVNDVPSTSEFRLGKRPQWVFFHEATYCRADEPDSDDK